MYLLAVQGCIQRGDWSKTRQTRTQLIIVTDNCSIYVCISKLRSFSKIIFLNVLFVIFHHWPGFINTVNDSSSIFFGELAFKTNFKKIFREMIKSKMEKVLELTFESNVIYLSHILAKICGKMKWQMVYRWEGHHFSGIFNNSLVVLYQFEFLKIILFFKKKKRKKKF